MIFLPHGVLQQQVDGIIYNPGMMTYDGSTGYYEDLTVSFSGNKITVVARFNIASFSGGGIQRILNAVATGGNRFLLLAVSNDHATSTRRDKIQLFVQSTSNSTLVRVFSSSSLIDGQDNVLFVEYDGDAGTMELRVNGIDEQDTGNPEHLLIAGTAAIGGIEKITVGASSAPANFVDGKIGYLGYRDIGGLDYNDFMDGSNPKDIESTLTTVWGSTPLYWNQFGTMDDNKGSSGDMTANGTITGPS